MNCLSHATSYTCAVFRRTSHFETRRTLYGCSSPLRSNFQTAAIRAAFRDFLLARFRFQCYSSRKGSKINYPSRKLDTVSTSEPEKEEFFVVRKGDIVGVYKSWSDCKAQVGSSQCFFARAFSSFETCLKICDPPVSVFKGQSLPKDTEEYFSFQGLKNAVYTIRVGDMNKELFGSLIPCTFHDEVSEKDETKKRSSEALELEIKKSCTLEFDGASRGNPGQAGAGAVLRAHDGSVICRLRQGLGIATNNVAEYRGMLLGLKYALKRGYTKIQVQGDSKLVYMQIQGLWKVKNQNMSDLCQEASELKKKFISFQISHVIRDLNSEADAQANLAVSLAEGEVQEKL